MFAGRSPGRHVVTYELNFTQNGQKILSKVIKAS
jgi:hypothetical protein